MKNVLIAAHRGLRGGNLVENTLPAFEAALSCGADILETDLKRTRDGVLVLFHDLDVHRLMPALRGPVEHFTLEELRGHSLRNVIGEESGCPIAALGEMLDALRGRCLINLDQSEFFIEDAWRLFRARKMEDQALFKGAPPFDQALDALARCDGRPSFVPVLRTQADIDAFHALPDAVRVPMVEVIFCQEDAAVFSRAFRHELLQRGIRLWVNALDLGSGQDLCAGHNDTVSVLGQPDAGWGFLIRHGTGVIQTDFPLALLQYLSEQEGFHAPSHVG